MLAAGLVVLGGVVVPGRQRVRTYNQGVILGWLAALHEINGDAGYVALGESIGDAALRDLTNPPEASPPGILIEPGEAG